MPWSRKNEVTDEWIDTDKKERFYLALIEEFGILLKMFGMIIAILMKVDMI